MAIKEVKGIDHHTDDFEPNSTRMFTILVQSVKLICYFLLFNLRH